MKKDIEWAKKEIEELMTEESQYYPHDEMIEKEIVLGILNQLDEPETLSIDKEQLIKRIENYIPLHDKTVGDVVDGILETVKQLPEMEILSHGWIYEHEYKRTVPNNPFVYVEDLQNLLVPKEESINMVLDDLKEHIKEQQSLSQNVGMAHTPSANDTYYRKYDFVLECIEEYEPSDSLENLLIPKKELPVVPKYVDEYLELAKSEVSLMRVLEIANRRDELPKWEKEYDWISANGEAFARAWLDGYTAREVMELLESAKSDLWDALKRLEEEVKGCVRNG